MDCPICRRAIIVEARGGPHPSPGDHDPAYHVAKAYHVEANGRCRSCSQEWPCPTTLEFATD